MSKKKRSYFIDTLRFIFAIGILLYHVPVPININEKLLFTSGYIGVEFFFIISGFMMAATLNKKTVDSDAGLFSIKFTINKFKKILPYTLTSMGLFIMFYYVVSDWDFIVLIN